MLVQFAAKNLGIACVVSDFAEKYLESGDVFTLEFEKKIPKRSMCIIADKKNPVSLAAKRLLELLQVKII